MRLALCFICLFVLVVAVVSTPVSKDKKPAPKKCIKDCSKEPEATLCAGGEGGQQKRAFYNQCVLNNHNCENGSNLKKVSDGLCPGSSSVRIM